MDEMMTIKLVYPGGVQTDVVVHPTDSVKKLESLFAKGERAFIVFNDEILLSAFSFSYYGIKQGSTLMVLPSYQKNTHRHTQKTKSRRRVTDTSSTRFKIAMGFQSESDLELVLESSRIKDQLFMKVEGNAVYHKKLMNRFKELSQSPEYVRSESTVCDVSPLDNPSTEVLPSIWATDASE